MAYLILVRHGESEWNKTGRWTGLTDIPLSEKGKEESKVCAGVLKNYPIDIVFLSVLKRSKETYEEMQQILKINPKIFENSALNERDYGDFTGRNKWQIEKEVGEEKFKKLRRGWNYQIPHGETLEDVYKRVVPYYTTDIEPLLKTGKNVLIVAHGNSLRALVKYLEHISDEEIENIELATGKVWIYSINEQGNVIKKEIKN